MATLDQLLCFLATHDIVDPTMECHEISVNKSQTKTEDPKHNIKKISDLLFQTLARPRNVKPEFGKVVSTSLVIAAWSCRRSTSRPHSLPVSSPRSPRLC